MSFLVFCADPEGHAINGTTFHAEASARPMPGTVHSVHTSKAPKDLWVLLCRAGQLEMFDYSLQKSTDFNFRVVPWLFKHHLEGLESQCLHALK